MFRLAALPLLGSSWLEAARHVITVIYLEHCLRVAGVPPPQSVVVVTGTPEGALVARDLADEIVDTFPAATVKIGQPLQPLEPCDLAVVALLRQGGFPGEDVVYASLAELRRSLEPCRAARHVLVYGAAWRGAEVIATPEIPRWLRRRRVERRLISLLRRSRWARWLAGVARGRTA